MQLLKSLIISFTISTLLGLPLLVTTSSKVIIINKVVVVIAKAAAKAVEDKRVDSS
jgi:hypothetical protein